MLKRELLLQIPEQGVWDVSANKWYAYPGEECSSGKCEPAVNSRVQILRLSWTSSSPFRRKRIKAIVGNFEIKLQGGKEFAGSFRAKFRSLPRGSLCE
jgi:hypothetical protein